MFLCFFVVSLFVSLFLFFCLFRWIEIVGPFLSDPAFFWFFFPGLKSDQPIYHLKAGCAFLFGLVLFGFWFLVFGFGFWFWFWFFCFCLVFLVFVFFLFFVCLFFCFFLFKV